jgi:hypothetical protein
VAITVQDSIDSLYQIAVVQGAAQSPSRLKTLAAYCVQEFETRGLKGTQSEQQIPGGGRTKAWDVGWKYDGKYRLAVSLKSILKNLAGTVPNRIDDLMGEAANVQLHSPEIVTGYIMVFDVGADAHSPKHGSTWSALLRQRLATLSGRHPPAWTIGTVEASVLAEVNFSVSSKLLSGSDLFAPFFDLLVDQVRARNPNSVLIEPQISTNTPQELKKRPKPKPGRPLQ